MFNKKQPQTIDSIVSDIENKVNALQAISAEAVDQLEVELAEQHHTSDRANNLANNFAKLLEG